MLNYHNRKFSSLSQVENGEVDEETVFHYRQEGKIVWATYTGGAIIFGTLVAKMNMRGELEMVYQHLNKNREFKTGQCHSVPEILPDGRIRLYESWKWTSGDRSSGNSIIEEIKD